MKITDEEKRIKIAEVCGWKFCAPKPSWLTPYWTNPVTKELSVFAQLPDYLNDLNAMHEAEKVLMMDFRRPDQWERYMDELNRLCYPDHEEEPEILGRRYIASCRRQHAKARIKAAAFGKTLNLWTE